MKPRSLLAPWGISLAVVLLLAAWAPPATAQVSPEEARAIGVDAISTSIRSSPWI